MGVGFFKCSEGCLNSIYDVFDKLSCNYGILESILYGEEVFIRRNIEGELHLNARGRKIKLPPHFLDVLDRNVVLEYGEKVLLENLYAIDFNRAYLYKPSDINRVCKRGIYGRYNTHVGSSIVFEPKSVYSFNDICEAREGYKDIAKSKYDRLDVNIDSFKEFCSGIKSNEDFKKLSNSYLKEGACVGRIFDSRGNILCRNSDIGYFYLDNLRGVESDFYNNILSYVIGLGLPVSCVYFYSDFNWSSIWYKKSMVTPGEYDILIK